MNEEDTPIPEDHYNYEDMNLPELPPEYVWEYGGIRVSMRSEYFEKIENDPTQVAPARAPGVAWIDKTPEKQIIARMCSLLGFFDTWSQKFDTLADAQRVVATRRWLGEWT